MPRRLAELVHDLDRTYAVEALAKMLPWSPSQLKDSLELLKLPANLRETLDRQAEQDAARGPIPVTVVFLGKEHTAFQQAMGTAKEEPGKGARQGQCLERICVAYLDRVEEPRAWFRSPCHISSWTHQPPGFGWSRWPRPAGAFLISISRSSAIASWTSLRRLVSG